MAAALAKSADVIALAPELAAKAGAQLDLIISLAGEMLDAGAWGERLSSGHLTLSAHIGSMVFNTSAAVGAVASRKIDKIQETYSSGGAAADAELASTRYGRMHALLQRRNNGAVSWHAGDNDHCDTADAGRVL